MNQSINDWTKQSDVPWVRQLEVRSSELYLRQPEDFQMNKMVDVLYFRNLVLIQIKFDQIAKFLHAVDDFDIALANPQLFQFGQRF